jgi:hypothetical protein
MDTTAALQALGLEIPSPAYLFGMILFSLIGIAAFRHGRRSAKRMTLWLGVALMVFPYAVPNTALLYAVGGALCAGLYFGRE